MGLIAMGNNKEIYRKYKQNMYSLTPASSIQDINSILDNYVLESELGKKLKKFSVFNHWEEIVGKEISRKAKPQKIFKSILYISVSGPSWANELSMMSEQLIEKINTYIGDEIITKLRFKITQ